MNLKYFWKPFDSKKIEFDKIRTSVVTVNSFYKTNAYLMKLLQDRGVRKNRLVLGFIATKEKATEAL